MALSLNAPIEGLKLSGRVRNVLHLGGLHTVGSLLECDYKAALRGFGPGARAELASALESEGLAIPARLTSSDSDDILGEITKLLGQMEDSFQRWASRIQHFELRMRERTARERRRRAIAQRSGQQMLAAVRNAAYEFRTRLTVIRTASACLLASPNLPERQEMVALMEEESLRLSLLVGRLIERLPPEGSRLRLPGQTGGAWEPSDERYGMLDIDHERQPAAAEPAGAVLWTEGQRARLDHGPGEPLRHV